MKTVARTGARRAGLLMSLSAALTVACGSDSGTPPVTPPVSVIKPLTVGDTVEFIIPELDSLVYLFHAPRGGDAAVYLQTGSVDIGVQAFDSSTGQPLNGVGGLPGAVLLQNLTVPFSVSAGQAIVLRVADGFLRSGQGRLFVQVSSPAPESRADTISPGVIYETEGLSLPSDFDQFHVKLEAGQHYAFYFQGIDHPEAGPFEMDVFSGPPGGVPLVGLNLPADRPGTSLENNSSPWVSSPETTTATMTVHYQPGTGLPAAAIPGRYRFEVREVNPEPESGDSILVPGDTITSSLDYSGDLDQFRFHLATGDTVTIFTQSLSDSGSMAFEFHSPTGDYLGYGPPVVVSDSGFYHLLVYGLPPENHGSYRLGITVRSPAPAARP